MRKCEDALKRRGVWIPLPAGKTATAVNLATAFAISGKRVLLIDLDPQSHATIGLGQDPESLEQTVYNLFMDAGTSASMLVVDSSIEGLSLPPSNILFSGVEFELASLDGREYILGNRLNDVNGSYGEVFPERSRMSSGEAFIFALKKACDFSQGF